MLLLRNKDQ